MAEQEETFTCAKCQRAITVTGATKLERLQQFKTHQAQCAPAPRPYRRTKPNKKKGFLTRFFRRPTVKTPMSPPQNITSSPAKRLELLQRLEALDDEAMAMLTPLPLPPQEAKSPPPTPNELPQNEPRELMAQNPVENKYTQIQTEGFNFVRKDLIKNLQDFNQIREIFLSVDQFTALAELYSIFLNSYISHFGLIGLADRQKETFFEITSEVESLFSILKGEHSIGKDYKNQIRFIELELFPRFRTAILMANAQTKEWQETAKQERLLELYKSFIPTEEDQKGLKDLLAEDKLARTEGP